MKRAAEQGSWTQLRPVTWSPQGGGQQSRLGGGAQRCQGAGASLGAMDDSRGLVCLMVGAGGMQIPGWVRQEVTAITSPKWVTLLFYFSFC